MKYIPEIQSLRGLCALGVLLNHNFGPGFNLTADVSSKERLIFEFILHILAPGASMVLVFFVISGFVLSPAITNIAKLPNFYIRRIFRIMPALWVSLAVGIISFNYLGREIKPEYYRAFYLMDISLNPPIWSLQLEMLAYLFLPVQLFFSRRTGVISCIFIILFLTYLNISENFYSFYGILVYPTALLCFQLGIEVPRLGKKLVQLIHGDSILFFIGLLFVLIPLPIYNIISPYNLGICNSIIAFGSFILISVVSYGRYPFKKALQCTPIVFLGTISYSFYLLHMPILEIVYSNFPYRWTVWSNTHGPLGNAIFYVGIARIIITLVILIPLSWISYKYIELPAIRAGNIVSRLFRT